jgi:hypothetical protein
MSDLNEDAPKAGRGDYLGGEFSVGSVSKYILEKEYKLLLRDFAIIDNKPISIYYRDLPAEIVVNAGYFGIDKFQKIYSDVERFVEVSTLTLDKTDFTFEHYTRPMLQVTGVFTTTPFRGHGIGLRMYEELIALGYLIVCDHLQYVGARKIWARLSKSHDYAVDVVDSYEGKLIAEDVALHQGDGDEDFSEEFWSYYHDKTDLLFVLWRK